MSKKATGHSTVQTHAASNAFAALMAKSDEARSTVLCMLSVKPGAGWRGLIATPPGSAMERVLAAFKQYTDIPLEIPFFAFLHFISGILLENDSRIDGPTGPMSPELWTVVLADSGSGKTWGVKVIEKASPVKSNMTEAASGAKFLAALEERPTSLWVQDEFAQVLKQIEEPRSPMGDAKGYLLRAYDNSPIERSTLKGTIRVERPVLGILGLNTKESFTKSLSRESLLDGFAQRFGFVWADADPDRPMADFPVYDQPEVLRECKAAFDALAQTPLQKEYRLGKQAIAAFKTSFSLLCTGMEGKGSYFRRAMFRAFKYAVLYHVMLGKGNPEIDAEDIGWGARVASLHIADMTKIIGEDEGFAGFTGKLAKARALKARKAAAGKTITARDVQMGVWGVKGKDEAAALFAMLGDDAPTPAAQPVAKSAASAQAQEPDEAPEALAPADDYAPDDHAPEDFEPEADEA